MMKVITATVTVASVRTGKQWRNGKIKSVFSVLNDKDLEGDVVCVKTTYGEEGVTYHRDIYLYASAFAEKFAGWTSMSTATIRMPADLATAADYESAKGAKSKILPLIGKNDPLIGKLKPVIIRPEGDLAEFDAPYGKVIPTEIGEPEEESNGFGEE